jgi:hypothetical protein
MSAKERKKDLANMQAKNAGNAVGWFCAGGNP